MDSSALELPLGRAELTNKTTDDDLRFDWINLFCREKYGAPELWRWFKWERKEIDKPHEFLLVEGGVCTAKIERGKRKGQDDWKKRDKAMDRTFVVARKDLDAFQAEWQARTGSCFKCYGTGQEWGGWSAANGNRYRPCTKCNATGNVPSQAEKATSS